MIEPNFLSFFLFKFSKILNELEANLLKGLSIEYIVQTIFTLKKVYKIWVHVNIGSCILR